MAGVNKVILVGNCGKDAVLRYTPDNKCFAGFTLATKQKWKDKITQEFKEITEWHNITCFGKLAEIAGQHIKKGCLLYVEGSIKSKKYIDKNGVEKYSTSIIVESFEILHQKKDFNKEPNGNFADESNNISDDLNDDIPF